MTDLPEREQVTITAGPCAGQTVRVGDWVDWHGEICVVVFIDTGNTIRVGSTEDGIDSLIGVEDITRVIPMEPASRIAELDAERQWQPISTALKDGTEMLLMDELEQIFLGYWRLSEDCWDCDGESPGNIEPTHWIPLPKGPKA